MREAGARLVPVAMADGLAGWDLPALAPGAARRRAPARVRRRRLPQPDRRARRRGPAPPPGRRGARSAGTVLVVDETMAELRLDDELEHAAAGLRLRPGGQHRDHGRLGQQGVLGGDADRLGAGGARRDPQPGRGARLRRPGHPRARTARRQLADAHRRLGAGRRDAPRPGPGEPGRAGRGGAPGAARLGVRGAAAAGSRCGCAPAASPAPGSPRWANGSGYGCRPGPASGSTGPSRAIVRLPFTVGGPVAEEAAARLAAAADLVRSGAPTTGAESPRYVRGLTGGAKREPCLAATVPAGMTAGLACSPRAPRPAVCLTRARAARRPAPARSSSSTACRCASLAASSYGSGVAGTWSRSTGPVAEPGVAAARRHVRASAWCAAPRPARPRPARTGGAQHHPGPGVRAAPLAQDSSTPSNCSATTTVTFAARPCRSGTRSSSCGSARPSAAARQLSAAGRSSRIHSGRGTSSGGAVAGLPGPVGADQPPLGLVPPTPGWPAPRRARTPRRARPPRRAGTRTRRCRRRPRSARRRGGAPGGRCERSRVVVPLPGLPSASRCGSVERGPVRQTTGGTSRGAPRRRVTGTVRCTAPPSVKPSTVSPGTVRRAGRRCRWAVAPAPLISSSLPSSSQPKRYSRPRPDLAGSSCSTRSRSANSPSRKYAGSAAAAR